MGMGRLSEALARYFAGLVILVVSPILPIVLYLLMSREVASTLCPACRWVVTATHQDIGKDVACPGCQKPLFIPADSTVRDDGSGCIVASMLWLVTVAVGLIVIFGN
jgi:hypothetical protein